MKHLLIGISLLVGLALCAERAAAQNALLWEVPFNFTNIAGDGNQTVLFAAPPQAGAESDTAPCCKVTYNNGYSALLVVTGANSNSVSFNLQIGTPCTGAPAVVEVTTTFNSASEAYVSTAGFPIASSSSCASYGNGQVHSGVNGWNGPNPFVGTLSLTGPVRITRDGIIGFFSAYTGYVLKPNDVIFMAASASGIFTVASPSNCGVIANIGPAGVTPGILVPLSCANNTATFQQQGGQGQYQQCNPSLIGGACDGRVITNLPNGANVTAPAANPQAQRAGTAAGQAAAAAGFNFTLDVTGSSNISTTVTVTTGSVTYTSPTGATTTVNAGQSRTFSSGGPLTPTTSTATAIATLLGVARPATWEFG